MKISTNNKKSRILSIIALVVIVMSIVGCATPHCGYMKHYNRDVRIGIAR